MKKLFSLLLLFVSITTISFAQDKIAKGTSFKILEIGSADAYYSERVDFLGKDATALSELTKKSNGFYSGTLETKTGRTVFFTDVKISVTKITSTTTTATTTIKTSTPVSVKTPKFITGTIKRGTSVYVADISPDDSYYSDRFEYVGKRGKVDTAGDLTMKEDGYYAGSFIYDDGSSAYFYKAKFSKEPVDKLVKTVNETEAKTTTSDNSFLDTYLANPSSSTKSDNEEGIKLWNAANNDDDIKEGDKVEVTAVSPEDSYYEDRDDYVGEKGIAQDVEYDSDGNGYGGTVKLDNGVSPYFYLVKLKKISSGTTSSTIAKNTKVRVIEVGKEDSFYSSKEKYERKTGKVADGLNLQDGGYYSGKIVFDDGTDAYFFNIKVVVL